MIRLGKANIDVVIYLDVVEVVVFLEAS